MNSTLGSVVPLAMFSKCGINIISLCHHMNIGSTMLFQFWWKLRTWSNWSPFRAAVSSCGTGLGWRLPPVTKLTKTRESGIREILGLIFEADGNFFYEINTYNYAIYAYWCKNKQGEICATLLWCGLAIWTLWCGCGCWQLAHIYKYLWIFNKTKQIFPTFDLFWI